MASSQDPSNGAKKGDEEKGKASDRKPSRSKAKRPSILIREMELEDLARVYALGEELFPAELWPNLYRTWDEYELVEFFASAQEYCFVAESDGEIVGFILGTTLEKRHTAWSYGWVVWLGVAPHLAGQGVGKRLLDKLTDVFIEDGVRILLADTDARNAAAIRFFEKQGFGSKSHHVYMTRNLTRDPRYAKRRGDEEKDSRRRKKRSASARARTRATPRSTD